MKNELIVYTPPSEFTSLELATMRHGSLAEAQQVIINAMFRRLAIPSQAIGGDVNYSSAKADRLLKAWRAVAG